MIIILPVCRVISPACYRCAWWRYNAHVTLHCKIYGAYAEYSTTLHYNIYVYF